MVCCHTDYDKVKAVLSDGVLILRQVVTLTMIKLKLSYQMVCCHTDCKVKAVLQTCHTDYDKVKAVLSDGVLILRQVVTLTMIKLKLSYQMVC